VPAGGDGATVNVAPARSSGEWEMEAGEAFASGHGAS
jgi:hypothetical protein